MVLFKIMFLFFVVLSLVSCINIPKTIEYDNSIPFTEIDGYKFHTETFGDEEFETVIIIHGGPGGDYNYLKSLKELSNEHRVVFYDQRGCGLSPRVNKEDLTLERNLKDLELLIDHFSGGKKVKLIGHSWGAMLVVGYLSKYPDKVSHAVVIEPGMLHPESAKAFVEIVNASQTFTDIFVLIKHLLAYPFVTKEDGQEGYDYVMTKLLNRNRPGGLYQCENHAMPPNIFIRGGYEAFNNMLKPVMDNPETFSYDLTNGITYYEGKLLMISSECSAIGFDFQDKYHISKLPPQTIHKITENMGHNMITLNPEWSLKIISEFLIKLSDQ
jgi:proline iminopeptidase